MIVLLLAASAAQAALPASSADDARRVELLRRRAAIDAELAVLGSSPSTAVTGPDIAAERDRDGDVVVTGRPLVERSIGQARTSIDDEAVRATAATTVADFVRLSPGVAVLAGNGPRDVGISIRGSNARNGFGARNIQVFEDGFPLTQPDGLARFDLADPHAYGAVDVVRGPSSALYGNYALAGALDFRTRRGGDVDGLEVGTDLGTDAYANVYATLGHAGIGYEYALFGSLVSGDGSTGHTGYRTGTINALGTASLGSRDRVTAKLIHNQGVFGLSTRLSADQYRANPYQRGCARAAVAAIGCGTISVFVNGANGVRVAQTAAEADLARDDRRTIIGVRWEHDLGPRTTWRTQATFDSRVVDQPTSALPFKGTLDSVALSTDLSTAGKLFGLDATTFVQLAFATLGNQSYSFNKTPAGRDGIGAPATITLGDVRNLAARIRQELRLAPTLTLAAGIGAERSVIDVRQIAFSYPLGAPPQLRTVSADRRFWNVAPEAVLAWQALAALRLRARVATGYGIPQSGQLFVTPAGVPGGNTTLRSQRNLGVDLGADLVLDDALTAELTVYGEWFRDELVSQSAGVNLLAYTSNVPRSVHRGIEAGIDWRPWRGLRARASWSWNDQYYTRYTERLAAGGLSRVFDRRGNSIPGVVPHVANLRIGYDRGGGIGGFVELSRRGRFFIDNANLLELPAATQLALNLHYDPPRSERWWSRLSLFASVQNALDATTIAGASVIADALDPATGAQATAAQLRRTTGSIYAGQPRTAVAGIRTRF